MIKTASKPSRKMIANAPEKATPKVNYRDLIVSSTSLKILSVLKI